MRHPRCLPRHRSAPEPPACSDCRDECGPRPLRPDRRRLSIRLRARLREDPWRLCFRLPGTGSLAIRAAGPVGRPRADRRVRTLGGAGAKKRVRKEGAAPLPPPPGLRGKPAPALRRRDARSLRIRRPMPARASYPPDRRSPRPTFLASSAGSCFSTVMAKTMSLTCAASTFKLPRICAACGWSVSSALA